MKDPLKHRNITELNLNISIFKSLQLADFCSYVPLYKYVMQREGAKILFSNFIQERVEQKGILHIHWILHLRSFSKSVKRDKLL